MSRNETKVWEQDRRQIYLIDEKQAEWQVGTVGNAFGCKRWGPGIDPPKRYTKSFLPPLHVSAIHNKLSYLFHY